jgi:hypothetical protein
MLLGSVLAPSLALTLLPALSALLRPVSAPGGCEADRELFQRIAEAERLRSEHARVRRLRDRLQAARAARGGFRPAPFQFGHPALWRLYWDSFERYAAAVRVAVAVPACTVAGIRAKLALAVIASRRGGARVYMYEDREWLEAALADLQRLGSGNAGTSETGAGKPARDRRDSA